MPEFLHLLPPQDALDLLRSHLPPAKPGVESVSTRSALDRVTARPVLAPEPLPAFSRSTVDGYAVRAADTFGASESLPAYLSLIGEVTMGEAPGFGLQAGQTAVIYTGGMLPEGADAVVMLEQTQTARAGELEVLKAVAPGENVLKVGEDVAVGQEVIPGGKRLRPVEIGGLLALGIIDVDVARPPYVGILSSGDEVVSPEVNPRPGQVRDINTEALSSLVRQTGGEPVTYGIVPDQREALHDAVARAIRENDAVIITAGSSASTRDLTADVIQAQGEPGVLVHGVNVRPGKPTILAVCSGKPVIGLPGNPVSALVIAGLFVVPVIEHLLGLPQDIIRPAVSAVLTTNLASQAGREDWVPVRLVKATEGYRAAPIFFKSNLIFNLSQADGLVRIPADANGISAGARVEVSLI